MHGDEVFWFAGVVAQFFSQLHDHLVQGARGAEIVVTPDFVEEAVAGKNFAPMGMKKLQEFQFPRGQGLRMAEAAMLVSAETAFCARELNSSAKAGTVTLILAARTSPTATATAEYLFFMPPLCGNGASQLSDRGQRFVKRV